MDSIDKIYKFVLLVIACSIFFISGLLQGAYVESNYLKSDAVENNAGCYYIDDNNDKVFRWGACDDKEE